MLDAAVVFGLARSLVELGGDLVEFLGGVVRREGRRDALQLLHLAAVGNTLDHFERARRIPWEGDFVVRPDARDFLVVVLAPGVEAAVPRR